MWRTCGAASPGPLGVERGALADAEAVLLVDDADREPRRSATSGSISAWVPTTRPSSPLAEPAERLAAPRRRGRAGEQRERDRPRSTGEQRGRGSPRAARRASRSAPSAPPGARPRPRAASRRAATTVLPEPTSPISSRCIGRPAARSASISSNARRWPAVGSNGSEASQRVDELARRLEGDPGPGVASRRAAAHRERRLVQAELLEREPVAGALAPARRTSGKWAPRSASASRRQPRGGRGARPAAARSRRPREPTACQAHSRSRFGARARGCAVDRDDPGRVEPGARRARRRRRRSRAPRPGTRSGRACRSAAAASRGAAARRARPG